MSRKVKPAEKGQLIDIYCRSCKRFLCGVMAGSKTYCPACKAWTDAEDDQKKEEQQRF